MNKIDLPLMTQAKRLSIVTRRSGSGVSVAARQKITTNRILWIVQINKSVTDWLEV